MEIWKGLLSYDKKKAKFKTYLNTLIHNRFLTLYARSDLDKNNMIDYYADVFATDQVSEQDVMTSETAESLINKRETIMHSLHGLEGDIEFKVLQSLLMGEDIPSMVFKYKTAQTEIIRIIKKIDILIKEAHNDG